MFVKCYLHVYEIQMFIEYNINGKQIFNAGAGSERVVAGQAPGRVSGQAAAERREVPPDRPTPYTFFFFFITLGLELSDTKVYAPSVRALLGTASHYCGAVVLESYPLHPTPYTLQTSSVSRQAAPERWEVPPDRPTPCTLHTTPSPYNLTLHPDPTPQHFTLGQAVANRWEVPPDRPAPSPEPFVYHQPPDRLFQLP